MINGIMVEGNWITHPSLIKDAFFQFYKVKFKAQDSQVSFPNLPHSQTLNSMDQDYLERLVTHEEIKEAVWDCGSSKAPSPDGFSFAFVKKYWDIIKKDLHDFINSFFTSCDMPYGANSSFFTSILKAPESVLNDLERIRSNFFWGGNQDGKKMAWVKWSIILNSYDNGGLNIVVKAFHGHEGDFDNNGYSFKGTWANIVGSSNFLHSKDGLNALFQKAALPLVSPSFLIGLV
ncbi:hypothetical protein Tco_0425669 [Tanacetum coccineum]